MIKYWPTQPSIQLNNAIVELFKVTENKIQSNLSNETQNYLYIDILNIKNKRKLLKMILNEFKNLLLDLIELNLSITQINLLDTKIFTVFIIRISKNFEFNHSKINHMNKTSVDIQKLYLARELIIYLIFGSSYIKNSIFSFHSIYTPYNHVQILFENFIIHIANIIIKNIIDNLKSSTLIYNFFKKTNSCNYLYTSHRSITLFLNNLKWQNLIKYYLYDTKYLYNEREKVLLISSKGLISKYIYISDMQKIKCLNQIQTAFLLWLEIKDIIIPKVEKIIVQAGKYLTYFFINFFSNLVITSVRFLIFYLNK